MKIFKNKSLNYTLFIALSLIAAPVLRCVSVFRLSYVCAGIYIACVLSAVAVICIKSFKVKKYAYAFNFDNPFNLDAFSYIASAGFFLNFIVQCVLLYYAFSTENRSLTVILTVIMSAVCSLVSSGYFIIVGFSFGGKNYDFKKFKFVHVFPLIWAITSVFDMYEFATGFEKSIDTILMYCTAVMLVLFFYSFALELDLKSKALNTTVFIARVASYLCILFFFDRLILVFAKRAPVFCVENAFSICALLMSGFIFFFQKNIFKNYLNQKTEK